MIDQETRNRIFALTAEHWTGRMHHEAFRTLASGKEIGHRIADMVDEQTTEILVTNFTAKRQYNQAGKVMPRSMGDIWILSNGIFNPVNVKASVAAGYGQPNMVSLKRLLRALLLRQIDSYYLLMVTMVLGPNPVVKTYFVDLLDILDFTHFDSGPGQIMLKQRQFYDAWDEQHVSSEGSLDGKILKLFGMLEDADRRLMENRAEVAKDLEEMRQIHATTFGNPIDQSRLNLA